MRARLRIRWSCLRPSRPLQQDLPVPILLVLAIAVMRQAPQTRQDRPHNPLRHRNIVQPLTIAQQDSLRQPRQNPVHPRQQTLNHFHAAKVRKHGRSQPSERRRNPEFHLHRMVQRIRQPYQFNVFFRKIEQEILRDTRGQAYFQHGLMIISRLPCGQTCTHFLPSWKSSGGTLEATSRQSERMDIANPRIFPEAEVIPLGREFRNQTEL